MTDERVIGRIEERGDKFALFVDEPEIELGVFDTEHEALAEAHFYASGCSGLRETR